MEEGAVTPGDAGGARARDCRHESKSYKGFLASPTRTFCIVPGAGGPALGRAAERYRRAEDPDRSSLRILSRVAAAAAGAWLART